MFRFTLGVEEEFQIVDPESGELRSHVSQLLASSEESLGQQVKRELHQSIVEVGTRICNDVAELREEIVRIRRELAASADRAGLAVAAAGTHPFSDWKDQVLSPGVRYESIVEELQQLARSLLIFGLHVHVAVPDRQTAIDLMNQARYFLPHLLALSTSSPFWLGRDTGLKSFRTMIFKRFPRTGVPDHFGSWSEFENYVKLLVDLKCIEDASKIWWDVRPHHTYGTLEFRVCDVPTRPADAVMLAALCQAIIVKLHKLYTGEPGLPPLSPDAHRGEQVAGRAMGSRRQVDRLWQADRGADARPRPRARGVRRRCGGRAGEQGSDRTHPSRPCGGHERRPAARGLSGNGRHESGRAPPHR